MSTCLILPECDVLADSRVVDGDAFAKHRAIPVEIIPALACIDKWVNSKFEDATPPGLCSGPKLAIWNKNQPPRPEKTPGHGEKSKMAILVLFGSRRSLGEKETDLYNDSCPTVFNLYDIHTPQTPARHP